MHNQQLWRIKSSFFCTLSLNSPVVSNNLLSASVSVIFLLWYQTFLLNDNELCHKNYYSILEKNIIKTPTSKTSSGTVEPQKHVNYICTTHKIYLKSVNRRSLQCACTYINCRTYFNLIKVLSSILIAKKQGIANRSNVLTGTGQWQLYISISKYICMWYRGHSTLV